MHKLFYSGELTVPEEKLKGNFSLNAVYSTTKSNNITIKTQCSFRNTMKFYLDRSEIDAVSNRQILVIQN